MARKCHIHLVAAAALLLVRADARIAVDGRSHPRGRRRGRGSPSPSAADGGRRCAALFVGPRRPRREIKNARPNGRRRSRPPVRADGSDEDGSDGGVDERNEASRATAAEAKTRFRARVAYSGTPYHGWQIQPNDRSTVQGEIEGALSRRFRRRVPVLGAGRTDAGVHARGQAVHFDLTRGELPFVCSPPQSPSPPEAVDGIIHSKFVLEDIQLQICDDFCNELQHSMNRMLPPDIRVFNLQLAPYVWHPRRATNDDESDENALDFSNEEDGDQMSQSRPRGRPWHAIQSARAKWYSYRLALGPSLWNPADRFARTHFVHRPSFSKATGAEPYALTEEDIARLAAILRLYEGTHDFKAFGGQLEQNERRAGRKMNTARTVYRVELVKEPLREDYGFGSGGEGVVPPPARDHLGFVGEEGYYRVDFLLQGALYKMVRNMVGSAMEVWLGRMSEERLTELLRMPEEGGGAVDEAEEGPARRRGSELGRKDNPCMPAPPEGLTLECVYYGDDF